jgi:predicted nucleic acid-binding protein
MTQNDEAVFVDTNIPMYAHGGAHPLREACRSALAHLVHGSVKAYSSTEVHQEILYQYVSLGRRTEARQVSRDFAVIVPAILPVTRHDIKRVWQLMVDYPGLACRDYVHLAVMLNNNLRRILSADSHFDLVREIVRVPPQDFTPDHASSSRSRR